MYGEKKRYHCPVCGYNGRNPRVRTSDGVESFEACPMCGVTFGCNDLTGPLDELRRRWWLGDLKETFACEPTADRLTSVPGWALF